ncbi:MAG: SDR family oxidoreductase [Litorimonas sp.]
MTPIDLGGRSAVVTGAGGGVGCAVVAALEGAGAQVRGIDVAEDRTRGILAVDMRDRAALTAAAGEVAAAGLDILVCAAGILPRGRMEDDDFDALWDRTLDVNLTGTFNACRAFMPALAARRGVIVTVCSVQSFIHLPNSIAYTASKGGLAQLTRALAVELGPNGVRVNGVAPGPVDTNLAADAMRDPARRAALEARTPNGRIATPADVAGPVLFLCSDLSRHVTGTVLPVDGGFTA